jgi:hypothetical protein
MLEIIEKNPGAAIGGAPGSQLDEQCAAAGIDKIRDPLK